MKNRMNIPQEYEPVLPGKVKAWLEKQKSGSGQQDASLPSTSVAAAEQDGQTIWYQCVDREDCFAKDGHKSYKQDGVSLLVDVLSHPENEGALMVTFQDNRLWTIQDGTIRENHETKN